jgi:hypothetical protein
MSETWLQPNRRALWFACIPPLVIAATGAWLAIGSSASGNNASTWLGAVLMIVSATVLIALARQLSRPRIAYRDGQILFNLRSGAPIAVPVHVVEAFFLGQGPANLPGNYRGHEKTVNLVARLAQRETAWARRDVPQPFGNWSDGYVTVRGTWCEPLDSEVVRRLNRRLREVQALTHQLSPDAAAV